MPNYNKLNSETSFRLGEVRFSYCHVFSKRLNPDGTQGKYGCCVLIPKTNTEALNVFKKAYEGAVAQGKATKWGGKIPSKVQIPLHDGDEARPDDPAARQGLLRRLQRQLLHPSGRLLRPLL